MFQSLAYRTLIRVHLAVRSLLWIKRDVQLSLLGKRMKGPHGIPRFNILPTQKVWIAWVRFYLSCAYGVRGSVPAIIFGWYGARPDNEWNIDWFCYKRLGARFRTVSSKRQARAVAHWYDSQVDMIDTYDAW